MGLRLEEQKKKPQEKVKNFRDQKFVTDRGVTPTPVEVKRKPSTQIKPGK